MPILHRMVALFLLLSTFTPLYIQAQADWHAIADSAGQFQKSGNLINAQLWAVRAAQAAKPINPTDSLWQVAVQLSTPLADSVRPATLLKAGKFFFAQNNVEKAYTYLTEGRLLGETLHLPQYYLDSYVALAQIATRRKDYSTVRQLYQKTVADSFALKHTTWQAAGLVGLADMYTVLYEFDSARVVTSQSLDLLRQLPQPALSKSYIQALFQLSRLEYLRGALSESMKIIDEAYALTNTHFPNDALLISIGFFYAQVFGDVNDEKALAATNAAQRILRKQVNYQQHPYYLMLLSNQIGLLQTLDRADKGAQVADSVFERHSMEDLCRLSRFDQFLSRSLRVYLITNQSIKADPIVQQAQRLLNQPGNGGANPSYLHDIIGRYQQFVHQWPDAVLHYKEEIRLDSVDQATSYLNHSLTNRLAVCQAAAGQRADALGTFNFLVDQFADNIRYNLWLMNEEERLNYLSTTVTHGLFRYILHYPTPQTDELGLAYNYKLLLRGASLRTSRAINQSMHTHSRIDSSALQELIGVRSQLANTRAQLDAQTRQRLTGKVDSLNRRLGDIARLIQQASQPVNWRTIQARLKPDEAAIEIIRYDNFLIDRPADSTFYAALVVRTGWLAPRLVLLPTLTNSDTTLLNNYLKGGSDRQHYDNGEIYTSAWQPISVAVGLAKRVYVAVDGLYQMISLPTLFNTQTGKYLLDETELVVVNSTQDLLNIQASGKPVSAELIGYPAYRLRSARVAKLTTRPMRSRQIKLRNGLVFDELPYTKVEVEKLAWQFRSRGIRAIVRTDTAASENAVHQWQSPSIVHIATHGFLRDSSTKANSISLLRCGLALAGAADTTLSVGESDGILTGYEASLLNLHKTELVVLSACQTGVGDYIEGEGVYGLQRAFLLAGSKAVLMSLWDVGDRLTQEFMTTFYQHWLLGMSKPAALRQTQRQLRKSYPQSYIWGAFVLLGQ